MRRSITKTLYTTTMTLAALGLAVAPASASSSSAGTSTGLFNDFMAENVSPLDPLPQCAVNKQTATLTLNNTPAGGSAVASVATVTIPAGKLFFNPAGTFTDGSCTIPGLVAATLTVTGAGACTRGTAQYGREGEVGLVTGSCGGHTWVFEGAQQPCFPDGPFPDPCAVVDEWIGTYQQI